MGDLRLQQVSQEDKQKSAREEKKSLQLVGQRAQIQIGGIRVREMWKRKDKKRAKGGEKRINDKLIEEN